MPKKRAVPLRPKQGAPTRTSPSRPKQAAKKPAVPGRPKTRAKSLLSAGLKKAAKQHAVPARPKEGAWAWVFRRPQGERRYWLAKSEPGTFSFDDLLRAPGKTTRWDGVRNYTARNFLRDGMKLGDRVFFYHSSAEPSCIAGICEVVREGYPDPTAVDATDAHFDPGSDRDDPSWFTVDLRAVAQITRPVTLAQLKARKELARMVLLRIGRLSVSPVTAAEWEIICVMAG